MANQISTADDVLTIKVTDTGWTLTYSQQTDRRVTGAEDGKLLCRSEKAAYEMASEMRSLGVTEALQLGYAVVFWV